MPAEAPAGLTTITLTNETKGEVDGQLVRTDEVHPDAEVLAEVRKAIKGEPIADWFHGAGGVGSTQAGKSGAVTQVLEPGTYYVLGGQRPPEGPPAKLTVTGEGGGALPAADGGRITASEYAFSGEAKAGKVKLELANTGREWHHFIAAPLKKDATVAEVAEFFKTEKGPPPILEEGGLESTVMDGGVSQVIEADLEPGRYAFVCFISDRRGGPPHAAKGMISEVTVK